MVGLGVRIQIEDKGIRVLSVIKGTGAERAGLQPGDLIFLANGKKVTGPPDLQGEEGSGVSITVKREVNKKIEDVRLTVIRHAFSTIIPETLEWPNKDIAVIKIATFDTGYNRDNINKLFDQAKGAKGLVLDLRSNGGGQVMNLLHLSGYFFKPDEPLGTFVSRPMVERYKKETGKDKVDVKAIAEWTTEKLKPLKREVTPYTGKIAVLIDGGTGSASEMMAAALKENRDALIVGNKSAGAVLASVMVPIKNGYVLQYPVTDYVTIKGHRLEGDGVKPDVKAPITRFGEKDKALEEAVKWIEKK
jgi:carboxyl-terminal processing protease